MDLNFGPQIYDSNKGVLRSATAEPFRVDLLVGTIFLQLEKRLVDRFAIGAIGRESDAIVFLTKNRAHGLYFAFAVMRRVIEQYRSIVYDGFSLTLLQRLVGFFHLGKFDDLGIVLAQILCRSAVFDRGDSFAREIFRTVNIAAQLLHGQR